MTASINPIRERATFFAETEPNDSLDDLSNGELAKISIRIGVVKSSLDHVWLAGNRRYDVTALNRC